ncbi:hypothetical protein JW960_12700 [candidate division KSB1 bacterium]|nr:hypothetical protein [candidate division KSB1 bacterium]
MAKILTSHQFQTLSTQDLLHYVPSALLPQIGVFVPNGTRRLALAMSDLNLKSIGYYNRLVQIISTLLRFNLHILFNHNLHTCLVPLISSKILKRDEQYRKQVLQRGLELLLSSPLWLRFLEAYEVRVLFYGNIDSLSRLHEDNLKNLIYNIESSTRHHVKHTLLFGIDSSWEHLISRIANFYHLKGHHPSISELIEFYYGVPIATADFFISSNHTSGLGALPPLICDNKTQPYYLTAPSIYALTRKTYRSILYDLYCYANNKTETSFECITEEKRISLKRYFQSNQSSVTGFKQVPKSFGLQLQ